LQSRYSAASVELENSTKFPGRPRLRATIPRLRNDLNEVFSPLSVFASLPGVIYLAQFEKPDEGG